MQLFLGRLEPADLVALGLRLRAEHSFHSGLRIVTGLHDRADGQHHSREPGLHRLQGGERKSVSARDFLELLALFLIQFARKRMGRVHAQFHHERGDGGVIVQVSDFEP